MADSLVVGVDGGAETLSTLEVAVALIHEAASVLLSVISQGLTAPRVTVDDLCKDINDLTAATRRLHRIAENVQRNARKSE